ncbi:UDP-N-acetylglucosamine pyrophosphorylase [Hominifimenecus sp. rT4P-3]|uniref:UDP-N-acetylglucosamine pyrophosphorylase n=1 Tax=Hominifimenecus sp. rT4P-3 TaxID=3242979 RepID=UPI003DA57FA6
MDKTRDLLDLNHTLARPLLEKAEYPWEALGKIKDFILELGPKLPKEEYTEVAEHVWVAKDAKVAPTAYLGEAVIVGKGAEIRHCAFIRGSALIGEKTVVGNSTELKNVILFDEVQVPHYNYVGDAILGYHAHMGAGSITSNIKADKKNVVIRGEGEEIATGLRKMGAVLGDWADIGCNSVLNPGVIVGRGSRVYPLSMVRGVIPAKSIYKKAGEIVQIRREE